MEYLSQFPAHRNVVGTDSLWNTFINSNLQVWPNYKLILDFMNGMKAFKSGYKDELIVLNIVRLIKRRIFKIGIKFHKNFHKFGSEWLRAVR